MIFLSTDSCLIVPAGRAFMNNLDGKCAWLQTACPVRRNIHRESLGLQAPRDKLGHFSLIFDQQQAHNAPFHIIRDGLH